MKTLEQITEKLLKQFEVDGQHVSFKLESIRSENEYYKALSEIVHSLSLSDTFIYATMYEFLEWLQEFEDVEDARDLIYEFADNQTPVYTSDLADWLAESNHHVYYLEESVNMGNTDGFKILAGACYLANEEVAHELLNAIEELI